MDGSRLAEVDRALAALGVDEPRIAAILAAHRENGHTLSQIDAQLAALAEGVALAEAPPVERSRPAPAVAAAPVPAAVDERPVRASARPPAAFDDIQLDDSFGSVAPPPPTAAEAGQVEEPALAEAPTRDLPRPDVPITEATTGSLPTVPSERPPDSGLSVDALFDEALAATAPPTAEVLLSDERVVPEEPVDDGPPVNVSAELAALLEGELDPREFEGGAPSPAAASDDLASMLEPDAADELEVEDVELIMDDDVTEGEGERTVVASASAMPPPPPPSQPPPDDGSEKKGFFRKMFGK